MTDHSVETPQEMHDQKLAEAERLVAQLSLVRGSIGQVVYGQQNVIDHLLVAILSGGHALLIGAPGLGKTLLVSSAAQALGLDTKRVQFTPDLMPSDITGSEILDDADSRQKSFRFLPGPVFTQMLLADEINRASPRTQSALLQAMQEYRVSQSGVEHLLPRPFHVLATQNPLDQEGTYPLPEAQLDRFMLCIPLTYPSAEAERQMLIATTGNYQNTVTPIFTSERLCEAQSLIRDLPIGERIVDIIVKLVRSLRPETSSIPECQQLSFGPGPRAAQALMLASRARALLTGRLSPSVDDIEDLAPVVLPHRMGLRFSAEAAGVTIESIIEAAIKRLV